MTLIIIFLPLLGFSQDVYSGGTGNYNAIQWYLSPTRTGAVLGGTPGASHTLNIGNGHSVTIPNGSLATFAGIVVHDTGASGALLFGQASPNTASTITVSGDIIVNSAGSFTAVGNGTGTVVHAMSVGGDIINNNAFFLIGSPTDRVNVTLNGTGTQVLGGTGGVLTFYNLTNSGGNDVQVNNNISVTNQLNFASNGIFILNSTSNITMGSGATIVGFSSARYIQTDGSTSSGSQLVVTNNGTLAAWQIVYPVGTGSGGYTPLDLTTANGAAMNTAPTANSTITVKPIYNIGVQGQMRRQFRIAVSGNTNGTTFSNGDFYYNTATDISPGDVQANYNTLWYLSVASGTWVNVTGTAPGVNFFTSPGTLQPLANGTYFYAIGNSTAFVNVWYSYQSGVWNDPDIWTLDPSGTSLVNPLTQSPLAGDQVVILNGFTVTSNASNITLSSTTIQGGAILDLAATSGHTLGVVTGSGLLRINGATLPSGNYAGFVATTGGTIEYYNTGGNLSTTQTTYNNLLFTNSTNASIVYTLTSNMTVNSDLTISQTGGSGNVTWQINDGSNTQRTIVLNRDLTVSANARIRTGPGNEGGTPHSLSIVGDVVNNGSIKLYDDTDTEFADAQYTGGGIYTNELQGNAVITTFSSVTNQSLTCNNQTDFYRFIVNKGTGQLSVLTASASNANNLRLWGPSNLFSSGTQPNVVSNCALSIVNGTLKLEGFVTIPRLIVDGSAGAPNDVFSIPQSGALWLNSPTVSVTVTDNDTGNDDQRLQVNGLLRITNGTLNCGFSRGIGSYTGGILQIEGGTLNMWQYRPVFGGSNVFVYIQTGGTVNVGTTGYNGTPNLDGVIDNVTEQFARFSLPTTTSTFQMSNGTLNIGSPSPNTSTAGANDEGIDIQSAAANHNVTGGTINAYIPSTGENFGINTTAPLFNLNIYREGTAQTNIAILKQATRILNNLTIVTGNNPTFNCNAQNLTIGGDLVGQANTTLTPGANIITFDGSGAQAWTHNGTITNLANNIVVNKSAGILALGGGGTFPNISGGLTITSGTLADGNKAITVTGSISNSGVHSGTGSITVTTATTIGGNNGTFGNLTITTSGTPVVVSGNQTVSGNLRLNGAASTVLNIGSNSLTVLGGILTSGTFGTNYRILTSGLHNAGGLTRQGSAGDLLFPFGSTAIAYTPITINVTATTHGLITARPVNGAHPVVTTTGRSLAYYWRVTSTDYAGVSAVSHRSYTYSTAAVTGTTGSYQAARYNPATFSWNATGSFFNAAAVQVIPNFSFGTNIDGEYTAGDNSSPFGAVNVFYSRVTGAWNVNTTWSTSPCAGAGVCGGQLPAGAVAGVNFPGPNNPVVIGNANNNHVITIDANNRSCGTLTITAGSTLNCGANTGLNFGANTGGAVSGNGTLRVSTTGNPAVFPAGDFTNFLGADGGTVEWYGNTKTLPTTGPAPQNISLATYYNLVLNPSAGQTITLPATNLTIHNDWTQTGAGTVTTTNNARTYAIANDLSVNAGTYTIANTTPANFLLMNVRGDVTVGSGAIFGVPGGGTATNILNVSGGITNNGTLRFLNGSSVNVTFNGTDNVTFGGTGSVAAAPNGTTLSRITIDKGLDQSARVDFTVGGTVTAATSGWLILSNGTFNFSNTGTYSISTASASYTIPASARLQVSNGTVNVLTANNTAADLILNGALEVDGGTVNIGNTANNIDNDIEYASAGSPTIEVSAGALNVNGAIRRSSSTLSGALIYDQSDGTVTVRGKTPDDSRGIFEIDNNTGSRFDLSGGILLIERPTDGSGSYADVYLSPETSNVAEGSTIQIGLATGNQSFRANIAPAIGNLTLNGTSNTKTTTLVSSNLSLAGNLTINSNATLVTNSLNVFIGGDLGGTGTYNGSNNTTTFNGDTDQAASLTGTSSFLNMTVDKSDGTVTLSGVSPTITNLNILNGILNVGTLNLTVQGNVVNNSSQIGTGAISLAGGAGVTAQTITSSGGIFTNLSLAGSATSKTVTVNGNMTINGVLTFSAANRYLNIGSDLLTFGTGSSVVGAGNTAFIKTNGSASDLGVIKNWSAGGASMFIYAVGTRTNYTPVTFTLTVSTAGSLNVIPVDDRHPTANTGSNERILNYYWIVTRGSTLAYSNTGSHVYGYPTALLGGTGGVLSAGYLDINDPTPGWETSSSAAVSPGGVATTTSMTYTNFLGTNLPGIANNTFHYAVGTPTPGTLPNPIIPVYSRRSDASVNNPNVGGDWNSVDSWTLDPTGFGPVWGGIPFGNSVVILPNSRINILQSGRISFITRIDGLLVMPSNKVGHNLGILRGTGTLRMPINTFPAGNYNTYVSSAGGTIEYVAPMTMNNRSTYNNISIIGTGGVIMTNTDLTLNGSITIGSTAILNNGTNNRNINMAGGWTTNTGGSFTAGTGTVTFNGNTSDVTVNGTTNFNNVAIAKTGGNVVMSGTGTTTVNNLLTLTSGNFVTSSTHLISLPLAATITGGSANSFISGPMRKVVAGGTSFTFPLGSVSANRYRPAALANTSAQDTWTAEYIGANPTSGLFPNNIFEDAIIKKVSMFEYWLVSRAGATEADLTLTYNTGSYIPNPTNIGNVANLRVVRWDGTQWDLPAGATFSQSGSNVTGTVTALNVANFSPFTFGSLDPDSPLPVRWGPVEAKRASTNSVAVRWITFQEINNDHFDVERSEDGIEFTPIGSLPGKGNTSVQQEYRLVDPEASQLHRYYYRIRQVDYDGRSDYSPTVVVSPEGEFNKFWLAYPNPVEDEKKFYLAATESKAEADKVDVLVYSSQGVLLYQGSGQLEAVNARLNTILQDASSGVYLLQISNGSITENFRIVRH